jgi:hypothetical protein
MVAVNIRWKITSLAIIPNIKETLFIGGSQVGDCRMITVYRVFDLLVCEGPAFTAHKWPIIPQCPGLSPYEFMEIALDIRLLLGAFKDLK